MKGRHAGDDGRAVTCDVGNTGEREGDDVVMAFHAAGDAIRKSVTFPVPRKSLFDFQRVRLAAGKKTSITFEVPQEALELVDADGNRDLLHGDRTLLFSNGAGQVSTVSWKA